MFGRKAARIFALEVELRETADMADHYRRLYEMWRGTAEAMRPCRFEVREDPPGSGAAVSFCLTHLCVHDARSAS